MASKIGNCGSVDAMRMEYVYPQASRRAEEREGRSNEEDKLCMARFMTDLGELEVHAGTEYQMS